MTALLTDDVWMRLDPHAGRLTRRGAVRMWALVLACCLLGVAALAVFRSGLVTPRLERDDFAGWSSSVERRFVTVQLPIVNRGWRTETVLGVGRDGPGLALEPPLAGHFPVAIPPGTGVAITLRYQVTSCAAVPQGDWPVPVRVSRPWGVQTRYLLGPGIAVDEPSTVEYSGRNPYEQPWQRVLAKQACAVTS